MTIAESTIAVAIPARDEAALIARCLDALAAQRNPGTFAVVVLANDCSDNTAGIARQPRAIDVRVIECSLPVIERSAGYARRAAMAAAAPLCEIILTTDADCVADTDWIAAHRAAFARGVDAVAGRVSGDWAELEQMPAKSLEIGALEWEYLGLIAEAEGIFAPRAHDPSPRHAQCCGANLGITRDMLTRIGGVPAIATGEDHALIATVEASGGLVRHDPAPHVVASARMAGRAQGGMADALVARLSPDYRCDHQFQRAEVLVATWTARRDGRAARTASPERLRPSELPAEIARLRAMMAAHG